MIINGRTHIMQRIYLMISDFLIPGINDINAINEHINATIGTMIK